MAKKYLQINNFDFSHYVSSLKITRKNLYNQQTNAAGDSVIDIINTKRIIEVGFTPITEPVMLATLCRLLDYVNFELTFLDPLDNELAQANCLIDSHSIDYYTIQENKVINKPFTVTFTEL